jgi:E3 ubiquitin-protein ligase HERC4
MCVWTDKAEVFAWGLGDYGALGTGEFKCRSTPTRVAIDREVASKLRQISCGAMHSAFLTEDGIVYACGSNEYGELGMTQP